MLTLPFDPMAATIDGVQLIASLIFFIQILKSFDVLRRRVAPDAWRGLVLFLGAVGIVLFYAKERGLPTDAAGWFALVLIGLVSGGMAMRAYDQTMSDAGATR